MGIAATLVGTVVLALAQAAAGLVETYFIGKLGTDALSPARCSCGSSTPSP